MSRRTREEEYDNEVEEDEELPKSKSRRRKVTKRDEPQIKEFSFMVNFGDFYVTLTYDAPEGYTDEDVEEFVWQKKDEGLPVYKPYKKKPEKRSRWGRGRNYDN